MTDQDRDRHTDQRWFRLEAPQSPASLQLKRGIRASQPGTDRVGGVSPRVRPMYWPIVIDRFPTPKRFTSYCGVGAKRTAGAGRAC